MHRGVPCICQDLSGMPMPHRNRLPRVRHQPVQESETLVSSASFRSSSPISDEQTQLYLPSDQPASDENFVAASTTMRTPDPSPVSDCCEGPPAKSRCLSSAASDWSMSDDTVVTLGSRPGGARNHRKPGDRRSLWHSE